MRAKLLSTRVKANAEKFKHGGLPVYFHVSSLEIEPAKKRHMIHVKLAGADLGNLRKDYYAKADIDLSDYQTFFEYIRYWERISRNSRAYDVREAIDSMILRPLDDAYHYAFLNKQVIEDQFQENLAKSYLN